MPSNGTPSRVLVADAIEAREQDVSVRVTGPVLMNNSQALRDVGVSPPARYGAPKTRAFVDFVAWALARAQRTSSR